MNLHGLWIQLGIASCLITVGHVFRTKRFSYLLPPNAVTNTSDLLAASALSYLVNFLVPARLGELVRVAYITKFQKLRFAPVLSALFAERYFDSFILTSFIFLVFANLENSLQPMVLLTGAALCAVTLLLLAIRFSCRFRLWFWKALFAFNDAIKISLAESVWNASTAIFSRKTYSPKFVLVSLMMWTSYLGAYSILLLSSTITTPELFRLVFLVSDPQIIHTGENGLVLGAVFLAPLILAFTYRLVSDRVTFIKISMSFLSANRLSIDRFNKHTIPKPFSDLATYQGYIKSLFGQERLAFQELNNIALFKRERIHSVFNGGSGAVVASLENDEGKYLRKLAVSPAHEKLEAQARWIKTNTSLPVVKIVNESLAAETAGYFYDMPITPNSQSMFDYIHHSNLLSSTLKIESIFRKVHRFHKENSRGKSTVEMLDNYWEKKVNSNLLKLQLAYFSNNKGFTVNGNEFTFQSIELFFSSCREMLTPGAGLSTIHGDLTIENIISTGDSPDDWFLIDPNDGNLYDSPLLDWAKLNQSLHANYEMLNSGFVSIHIEGNSIKFTSPRSHVYTELEQSFKDIFLEEYSSYEYLELRIHELIHFLRLIPYKLESKNELGALFLGQLCSLISEFEREFSDGKSP